MLAFVSAGAHPVGRGGGQTEPRTAAPRIALPPTCRNLPQIAAIVIGLALLTPVVAADTPAKNGDTTDSSAQRRAKRRYYHRFRNASAWSKHFDSPKRDKWQRPSKVIAALKLKADSLVADIGSGTGYFAVRIAKAIPRGHLWGLDVEVDMVRYLRQRAKREQLANLTSLKTSTERAELPKAVDRVFICNTYHHLRDRVRYFGRLRRHLRPGARLVIVDFRKGNIPVGPPERHRIAPQVLDRELVAAGYRKLSLDRRTLPYQYIAQYAQVTQPVN